jgi:hypothetical protein
MRTTAIALVLAFSAWAPAAPAQDRGAQAGPGAPQPAVASGAAAGTRSGADAGVVPVEGSTDRDVTLRGYVPPPPCRDVLAEAVVRVGPATGEAEKDTLGRPLAGLDCRR